MPILVYDIINQTEIPLHVDMIAISLLLYIEMIISVTSPKESTNTLQHIHNYINTKYNKSPLLTTPDHVP